MPHNPLSRNPGTALLVLTVRKLQAVPQPFIKFLATWQNLAILLNRDHQDYEPFFSRGTRTKPGIYIYYIQKKALRDQNKKNSVSLFVVYMFFCQNIFHELVFHLFTSVELFFRGFPTTRTTLTKKTQEAQAKKNKSEAHSYQRYNLRRPTR